MNWFVDLFTQPSTIQTLLVLAIIAAAGLALGKIKIYGISLGITFVFFAGILAGHFGIEVNKDMLAFAQNTGLIIFVYTLGLQVGPGFFSSFKKGGVKLNLLGIAVVLSGFVLTIGISLACKFPVTEMTGLFSGAVTNTPMLGAAQQAAMQVHPGNPDAITAMSLACAVGYPVGVIGMIAVIIILRMMNRGKGSQTKACTEPAKPFIAEFQICNPAIFGKTIKEITALTSSKFVISRVWRKGKVSIPTSDTVIAEHDHLLVISNQADVEKIKALFGEKENSRKAQYGICDPMFRFWYRYVSPNKTLLETGAERLVWTKRIAPDLSHYMVTAFEMICREYLLLKNSRGELPVLFTKIGRWWGTDPEKRKETEIDLIAEDGEDYLICECKWRNELTDRRVYEELKQKADVFRKRRHDTWYVLFSKSGFSSGLIQEARNDPRLLLVTLEELLVLSAPPDYEEM